MFTEAKAVPSVVIPDAKKSTLRERDSEIAEQAAVMMERGVTATQVSAYLGVKMVKIKEKQEPIELRVTPSHKFVGRDKDGKVRVRWDPSLKEAELGRKVLIDWAHLIF